MYIVYIIYIILCGITLLYVNLLMILGVLLGASWYTGACIRTSYSMIDGEHSMISETYWV